MTPVEGVTPYWAGSGLLETPLGSRPQGGFRLATPARYPGGMPKHSVPPSWALEPGAADPLQLTLWDAEPIVPRWDNGMPEPVARALVPPGWWPGLRILYAELAQTRVYRCEERQGFLALEIEVAEGPLEDRVHPVWLRTQAERTCMCCGESGVWCCVGRKATPVVACDACRERLDEGETVLGIAAEHFDIDGRIRAERKIGELRVRPSRSPVRADQPDRDLDVPLSPPALRGAFEVIHNRMRSEVVGQTDAVASLALLGALHVGAALPRGPRALIVGPTGAGKTHVISALLAALGPWGLPAVRVDAIDLTSPGWSGAPSIGQLIDTALAGEVMRSARGRRMVVHLDEIHHVGYTDGQHGNMQAKRQEVFASLLALTGGGLVQLGESRRAWDSTQALVLVSGAFTGLDLAKGLTVEGLVRWGFPVEFAARITETVIPLERPDLATTAAILRAWPGYRSLVAVGERLGLRVVVPDETLGRAARAVTEQVGGATVRTAAGWLVTAVRAQLLERLLSGSGEDIGVSPDALPIRYGDPGESDGEPGPWDGPSDASNPGRGTR